MTLNATSVVTAADGGPAGIDSCPAVRGSGRDGDANPDRPGREQRSEQQLGDQLRGLDECGGDTGMSEQFDDRNEERVDGVGNRYGRDEGRQRFTQEQFLPAHRRREQRFERPLQSFSDDCRGRARQARVPGSRACRSANARTEAVRSPSWVR